MCWTSELDTHERSNESTGQEGDDVRPNRHGDVLSRSDDDTEDESDDQDEDIPPVWNFLVFDEHGGMVSVLGYAGSKSFDRCPDVFTPKESDVGDESTNLAY